MTLEFITIEVMTWLFIFIDRHKTLIYNGADCSTKGFEMAINNTYNEDHSFNEVGARDALIEFIKKSFKTGHKEYIGKVLFAHLICEKLLVETLQALHPSIGDISKLQIGFSKILDLIVLYQGTSRLNPEFVASLRSLNKIRNHIAHSHDFQGIPKKHLLVIKNFCKKLSKKEFADLADIEIVNCFLYMSAGIIGAFIDGLQVIRQLDDEIKTLEAVNKHLNGTRIVLHGNSD